ncbi:MAG: hypothetical protein ACYDAG_04030 [Chloroflexota bacterium]
MSPKTRPTLALAAAAAGAWAEIDAQAISRMDVGRPEAMMREAA